MRIGLINDRPDHPMLAELIDVLTPEHQVDVLDENAGAVADIAEAEAAEPAALYLCKSHTAHALELADALEGLGACVINAAEPTRLAQDRVFMATQLGRAGISSPATAAAMRLSEVGPVLEPIVVKSRISRRGDLVAHVEDQAGLQALLDDWGDESVITQPWVPNSGWDLKLWVVQDDVFGAHRPSPLDLGDSFPDSSAATVRLHPADVPARVRDLAYAVGEAFDLQIYGVDVIVGPDEAVVVDVNPFPGARGIPGFAHAIAELATERISAERVWVA